MSQLSRPWAGTVLGDAGPYTADQWSKMYRDLFRANGAEDGPLYGSGVLPDKGLTVQQDSPPSANVVVTPGSALVHGTWFNADADETLTIAANGTGNARIDTIVMQKDWSTQTIRLVVLQGTPAGSPVPPTLTQSDGVLWESPLADIAVASGFTTITTSNISPRYSFSNAADGIYLYGILNNSGGTLETGDLVIWDSTTNRAVKTTTTQGDQLVAGVWQGRTDNGDYGRILVQGIGYVKTTGAIASRYAVLVSTSTAKKANIVTVNSTSKVNGFGISLETTSGGGYVLAYVDVRRSQLPAFEQMVVNSAVNEDTTSTTFVDFDTATYLLTLTTNTGRVRCTASFWANTETGIDDHAFFDWQVDATTRIGGTNGIAKCKGQKSSHVTCDGIFSGLTPGTHTFRPQFRSETGALVTVELSSVPMILIAQEI